MIVVYSMYFTYSVNIFTEVGPGQGIQGNCQITKLNRIQVLYKIDTL